MPTLFYIQNIQTKANIQHGRYQTKGFVPETGDSVLKIGDFGYRKHTRINSNNVTVYGYNHKKTTENVL